MSTYPKQLVADLSEQLNPKIIAFFEQTLNKYAYPVQTVSDLVEYTLEDGFGGKTSKEDLRSVYDASIRSRRKKKARWTESLKQDTEMLLPTDKAYPFAALVAQQNVLTPAQWKQLYGDVTRDELIKQEIEKTEKWQKDSKSYFIDFPCLNMITPNNIFKSMVSDTLIDLYNIIDAEYGGSLDNYFYSFPKELLGIPLFSVAKSSLSLVEGTDGYTEKYVFDEQDESFLETNLPQVALGRQLRTMDKMDLLYLVTSLQSLEKDFYTTRTSKIKRTQLAKLLNPRPGKKHYEAVDERCLKLSKYNYTVKKGSRGFSFNLLDNVDTTDPEYITFTYGQVLYNNIIQNELTNVKSKNIQLLEQDLSVILFQSLFNERIILSAQFTDLAGEDADLVKDYPYKFFYSNARFPTRSRKKNLPMIEQCLQEFVDKHIVIKSFSKLKEDDGFRIHFYPLSEEEQADLSYNRIKNGLPSSDEEK